MVMMLLRKNKKAKRNKKKEKEKRKKKKEIRKKEERKKKKEKGKRKKEKGNGYVNYVKNKGECQYGYFKMSKTNVDVMRMYRKT